MQSKFRSVLLDPNLWISHEKCWKSQLLSQQFWDIPTFSNFIPNYHFIAVLLRNILSSGLGMEIFLNLIWNCTFFCKYTFICNTKSMNHEDNEPSVYLIFIDLDNLQIKFIINRSKVFRKAEILSIWFSFQAIIPAFMDEIKNPNFGISQQIKILSQWTPQISQIWEISQLLVTLWRMFTFLSPSKPVPVLQFFLLSRQPRRDKI